MHKVNFSYTNMKLFGPRKKNVKHVTTNGSTNIDLVLRPGSEHLIIIC